MPTSSRGRPARARLLLAGTFAAFALAAAVAVAPSSPVPLATSPAHARHAAPLLPASVSGGVVSTAASHPVSTSDRERCDAHLDVLVRRSDGAPVAGAQLFRAGPERDPWTGVRTTDPLVPLDAELTDERGRTCLAARGIRRIWCVLPSDHGFADISAGAASVEIAVERSPTPSVVVRTQAGQPAAGVPVVALRRLPCNPQHEVIARCRTDARGIARFDQLAARPSFLSATDGIAVAVEVLGATFGHTEIDTPTPLPLHLPPLTEVRLVADGLVDHAADEAVVAVSDGSGLRIPATSMGRGVWSVPAVAGATIEAVLEAPGCDMYAMGTVPQRLPGHPFVLPLELARETVRIRGRVTGITRRPLAVVASFGRERSELAACDRDGSFCVTVLRHPSPVDVRFTLYTHDGSVDARAYPFACEPRTLALQLNGDVDLGTLHFAERAIRGRVVDADGHSVADARVEVQQRLDDELDLDRDGSPSRWAKCGYGMATRTATDGAFTIDEALLGYGAGPIRLRAEAEGFRTVVSEGFVGRPGREVCLQLLPDAECEGVLVTQWEQVAEQLELFLVSSSGLVTQAETGDIQAYGGRFAVPFRASGLEPGRVRARLRIHDPELARWVPGPGWDVGAGARPLSIEVDPVLRVVRFEVIGGDDWSGEAGIRGHDPDGQPQVDDTDSGAILVALDRWRGGEVLVRADGHQTLRARFDEGTTWTLTPQAETQFEISEALAARVAGRSLHRLEVEWVDAIDSDAPASGVGWFEEGSVALPLPPGQYQCEISVGGRDLNETVPCATVTVPARAPPGPVRILLTER